MNEYTLIERINKICLDTEGTKHDPETALVLIQTELLPLINFIKNIEAHCVGVNAYSFSVQARGLLINHINNKKGESI